jgi:predicted metalloprotease
MCSVSTTSRSACEFSAGSRDAYLRIQHYHCSKGEAQEALRAAAVGDDRLQRAAGHQVSPESFTHGSSEQRMHWFQQGFTTGDLDQCNTFASSGY